MAAVAISLVPVPSAEAAPQKVNHRVYEKTPDNLTTSFYRYLAMILPATRERAFWGNWGGSGNRGGKPVDVLDEGFRRHDVVYYEARGREQLEAADRALVIWLQDLDPSGLTEAQLEFRDRALRFFRSPLSNIIGKSPVIMFRNVERPDCFFSSPGVVAEFFDPGHPGFPSDLATHRTPVVVPEVRARDSSKNRRVALSRASRSRRF